MAMIQTQDLTKTFKARKGAVEAVRGVDLVVNEGEIFGFLGPNGAGKTTTMRMLATLLQPTSGKATVCGYDLQREPGRVRRQIGYVGQKGGAEASETGRENLLLQGRLYGMSKGGAQKRAAELIGKLDLEPFAGRLVRTYSGGQRRRLDIAMGMMHRPRLLFLDEPTTGLDPQSRVRIWDEVRRLRDEGVTIFLMSLIARLREGVVERWRVTPVSRLAMMLGLVAVDLLNLLAQDVLLLGIGLLLGFRPDAGGMLLLMALLLIGGLMMASCSYAIALVLKNESSLSAMVNLFALPLLLLSGVMLPLSLAPDILQQIARANPFAYAITAGRALVGGQLSDTAVMQAFIIFGIAAVLALFWATRSLRKAAM
jgi:ABC-2 type transport system ATP-binding protein